MRISSVKFKLTVTNIGILTLVLFGFLAIVHFSVRGFLIAGIDRRLHDIGDRSARMFSEWDRERQPDRRPPPPDGRRRGGNGARERMVRLFDMQGRAILPSGEMDRIQEPPLDTNSFNIASTGQSVLSMITKDDVPYRVYLCPLYRENRQIGVIQTAMSFAEVEVLLNNLTLTLIALMPVALILAGIGGLLLTSRALRPVRQIVDAANSMSPDDLSQRLPVVGADEFSHLASTVNNLLARLENTFTQMRRAFELERRFTADASHELRTPLTAIKANTSLALRSERTSDEYKKAIHIIDQAADSMNHLIQDLLLLAQSDGGQLTLIYDSVDPLGLLNEAVDMFHCGGKQANIRIKVSDDIGVINGDHDHLRRLVYNLLDNALHYTPSDGEVILEAFNEGDKIAIVVTDTGEGIAEEHLPHLGERFYRVDPARNRNSGGTGLGLAICRSIVEEHDGTITIESKPGSGTKVKVLLKRTTPS